MSHIIEAKNIFKHFGQTKVLCGIDICVEKGEILAIVGPSGAGKSTLLQIISSLEDPSEPEKHSTTIEIKGQDIIKLKGDELSTFRAKNIGFIFQNNQLLPEFTAEENIAIASMILGTSIFDAKKKAGKLLSMLGLLERKNHKPSELSGGEQQRVAIARALINEPSVIFADEPSGNLDEQTAQQLHQIILHINKELKTSFVIVTHSTNLAALSHKTFVMEKGLFV